VVTGEPPDSPAGDAAAPLVEVVSGAADSDSTGPALALVVVVTGSAE
jgi:hypothetical protein